MDPDVEASEEQDLRRLWGLIEDGQPWEDVAGSQHALTVAPGSRLAEDDAATAPFQLSHSAWQALLVAVDHLRALRLSLAPEERDGQVVMQIYIYAQATLLRAAIENAARATWMLESDDRVIRVIRRLSLDVAELDEANKLRALLPDVPQLPRDAHRERVRGIAAAAGASEPDIKWMFQEHGYGEIVYSVGGMEWTFAVA